MSNIFNFAAPPAIGTQIVYYKNVRLTLIDIEEVDRIDGKGTWHRLTWQTDWGGQGTSGLRARNMTWTSGKEPYDQIEWHKPKRRKPAKKAAKKPRSTLPHLEKRGVERCGNQGKIRRKKSTPSTPPPHLED